MYCVSVCYNSPAILHKVHNDVKNLQFVIGNSFIQLDQARAHAIKYINNTMEILSESTLPYITSVPMKPETSNEWNMMPDGLFCCEHPFRWKIYVYNKIRIKGFLFDSFKFVKIFHINIIQVRNNTCRNSPAKHWFTPDLLRATKAFSPLDESDETYEI